jgi:lipoprotein-releasing system permease protein
MKFELLVAIRYLKAKRKQAVISLITLISVIGVAAGVAALIIALAINEGFHTDLQKKLLGVQPDVAVTSKERTRWIADYMRLVKEIEQVPGVVTAAPAIYQTVLVSAAAGNSGVTMKGVIPEQEARLSALSENMTSGSLADLKDDTVIIGQELSKAIGAAKGDHLQILTPETHVTPLGEVPRTRTVEVAGLFSSGLEDVDKGWIYVPLATAQQLLGWGGRVEYIDVKVNDVEQAHVIGQRIVDRLGDNYDFTDWMALNHSIFQALQLEKLVMFITIGLIVVVAALNIVATLIMMVLEKTRDIAILMSMGATNQQIRRIFILQGVIIGMIGTFFGVIIGQVTCYFADKYHLVRLAPDVYTIAYVPFKAAPLDSVTVAVTAILISFLATLYPSAAASKLQPVESLRYE